MHILGFFLYGDPNQRHSHLAHPFIPLGWTLLLIFGLIICYNIIRSKPESGYSPYRPAAIFGLSIFVIMLLPGILTYAFVPKTLRIIGVLPGLFLLAALPIEYLLAPGDRKRLFGLDKTSLLALVFIIIFVSGIMELRLYFFVWADFPGTKIAFYDKFYDLGLVIGDLPLKPNNTVIFNPDRDLIKRAGFSMAKAQTTAAFAAYPKLDRYAFVMPDAIDSIACAEAAIILVEFDRGIVGRLKRKCPALMLTAVRPMPKSDEFYVFN